MDKPEWCRESAWNSAKSCVFGMSPNMTDEELFVNAARVARAILSAQSQAYIDAARIAEEDGEREISWSEMSLPVSPGPIIAKDRAKVASRISAAILSRKDEVGRN